MFFMSQRTAYFLPQGQKGGWGIKKREGGTSKHSSKSFVFRGLPLLFGFHDDDTEKSGETIATPPERGVPTGPDSGTVGHASIPAPGGRYRQYLSLREGSEKDHNGGAEGIEKGTGAECPLPLASHDSKSVLAVKGQLCRFAPWTAAGRSEGDGCLRGKGGGWAWLSGCFGPCGRAEREPFGHTSRLSRRRRGSALDPPLCGGYLRGSVFRFYLFEGWF